MTPAGFEADSILKGAHILAGVYSDLKVLATWDIPTVGPDLIPSGGLTPRAAIAWDGTPGVTPAQWSALRRIAPELVRQRAMPLPGAPAVRAIQSPEPGGTPPIP